MTSTPAACSWAAMFCVAWKLALLASQLEFWANPSMPMLMFTDTTRWPALRRLRTRCSERLMSLKAAPQVPPPSEPIWMAMIRAPSATPSWPPVKFEPAAMLATCVPCSQWRVTGV